MAKDKVAFGHGTEVDAAIGTLRRIVAMAHSALFYLEDDPLKSEEMLERIASEAIIIAGDPDAPEPEGTIDAPR